MGARVSNILTAVNVIDYIELSPEIPVAEVAVSPDMTARSLKELDLRTKYGVTVLAIKKSDDEVKISPSATDSISEGDHLVLVGPSDGIHNIREKFQ
jgi:trk system potassium uptake protein TrkA